MTKPDEDYMEKEETWGTLEELLLAYAVSRYGTNSWDSVAMEIQNRTSSLQLLTPQNCKQKYEDLKLRFMAKDDDKTDDESDTTDDKKVKIPWLDELRKLRVHELRREVQQYDVSIVSLQLKVKRLKEERERSVFEKENDDEEKPDLEKDSMREKDKDETEEGEEVKKSSPEKVPGEHVSGEESDRDNQSFNESNSTDQKDEHRVTGIAAENKPEPVESGHVKPDPVSNESKPVGEGSYNGSSETIAKDSTTEVVVKSLGAVPAREGGDSPGLWESVAESKGGGGEEGTKESSDVQSSASLSKKNRRRKRMSSGSSSGEEPETDEISPAIERICAKPQPLVGFLEIIRSHKFGSVFERRLEIQETNKYRSLIRQHLDLESVQVMLEEGRYSGYTRNFFRDLLLLFNNAIVFFPKNSHESIAAIELRQLVRKEMTSRIRQSSASPPKEPTPPPVIQPLPPPPVKSDPEQSDSLLVKPKSSGPIIACRKRSSISAKASSTAAVERKILDQKAPILDEKPVANRNRNQLDDSSAVNANSVVEEQSITKKRTRERSASGARSSRSGNNKSRINTNTSKNSNPSSSTNHGPGPGITRVEVPNDNLEPRTEKKTNNNVNTVAKKRSAANFLNRMKRNSSSNGTLLETLKSSVNNSNNGSKGGSRVEPKKNSGIKGDVRKEQVSRHGKQTQDQSNSPAKRSVGRPPKRAVAPPPPPAPAKRTRETVETEGTASRQPRKRSRR